MKSMVVFGDLYTTLDIEEKDGLLSRNMRMYEAFIAKGGFSRIYYVTYSSKDRDKIKGFHERGEIHPAIEVLCPPPFLDGKAGSIIYSLIAPFWHYRAVKAASILRTHQVSGSWTGVISRLITGKPLIFRLGYPLSVRFKTENKPVKFFAGRCVEKLALTFSKSAVVSSHAMRAYYAAMAPRAHITVVPNFVDLSRFKPIERYDPNLPILFVGRLEPVKNIPVLIAACARLGVRLDLYGHGSREAELRDLAAKLGAEAAFMGSVSNEALAQLHHQHSVYVLCSTREGMPKSLIEAMASGLICISTPTDGGSELIEDGVTGYLTEGYDEEALSAKIAAVLGGMDPEVGRAAARDMQQTRSMDMAVEMELSIMASKAKLQVDGPSQSS